MSEELLRLGVVDVGELSTEDWGNLHTWSLLRTFEKRRVLQEMWRGDRHP